MKRLLALLLIALPLFAHEGSRRNAKPTAAAPQLRQVRRDLNKVKKAAPGACCVKPGCDLCLPPCPMDCITMIPVLPARAWSAADADRARHRYGQRNARLIRARAESDARLAAKAVAKLDELDARDDLTRSQIDHKKAVVQAAIERAQARRAAASTAAAKASGGTP